MSMESAKTFIEKMNTDHDFCKKVVEYKNAEARKAFVLKEGFDFTLDDLNVCKELNDEELNSVVGGVFTGCENGCNQVTWNGWYFY